MKKIIGLFLVAGLLSFAACGEKKADGGEKKDSTEAKAPDVTPTPEAADTSKKDTAKKDAKAGDHKAGDHKAGH